MSDAEQQLIEEAQAHEDLESLPWWKPGDPWWLQDQNKLREWHDNAIKHFKRG